MEYEKYALLDTDFISKMHLIRKNDQNKLIDKIIAMPGYCFYCHEQVKIELMRHNIAGSPEWLEKMISEGIVLCYDDEQIMDDLKEIYGNSAPAMYMHLMKTACESYKAGYFDEKFVELAKVYYSNVSRDEFLEKLRLDCDTIGEGQNLGELKTYVLLQTLSIKYGEQIYVFCSDDKNARNGVVSIGGAKCISVLSSFLRLQKECDFKREDAESYIQSYLEFCKERNQTTFKVQDASKERRWCKVPCEQVFEDMFAGKLEELKTGNLKYIQ
jgi:hypothetical protein